MEGDVHENFKVPGYPPQCHPPSGNQSLIRRDLIKGSLWLIIIVGLMSALFLGGERGVVVFSDQCAR